jgi:hypothetical protein
MRLAEAVLQQPAFEMMWLVNCQFKACGRWC